MRFATTHCHDIEAAGTIDGMFNQVVTGGGAQARLLASVDGFGWRPEGAGMPVADFHEYQHFAVAHYQVDLALGTTVVAGDKRKPSVFEMRAGEIFRLRAAERLSHPGVRSA